jgi:hypothetical protein
MKTEYAVGNLRIHFESQTRRRWFVAFVYAVLAAMALAGFSVSAKTVTSTWISVGCMILFVGLFIVLTGVAGDMRVRGDEREIHRRDHAHFMAYRFFGYFFVVALIARYFRGPHPIAPLLLPLALQGALMQLSLAAFFLYLTLPQAILLWTEPDMEQQL